MSILGPDDAKELYQAQVPGLRDDFAANIAKLKSDAQRAGTLYDLNGFLGEVAKAAKDEMRKRNRIAMESVMRILDSGWKPSPPLDAKAVFLNCFSQYQTADRESFSDINESYELAWAGIGHTPNSAAFQRFRDDLGRTQVNAANECFAKLKAHIVEFRVPPLSEHEVVVDMPASESKSRVEEPTDKRKIFVVHGRDQVFRAAMNDFLRALKLEPLEWEQAVALTEKASPYISEVIEAALKVAQAILILLTPDNEARLRPELWREGEAASETAHTFHPRQNVIYEAGMAFAMAPNRSILIMAGSVSIASDILGRNYITFTGDPNSRTNLITRLRTAGCAPDISGIDWLNSGTFPDYSNLRPAQFSDGTAAPASSAEFNKSIDPAAFAVRPTMSISLHPGRGGPDGHFLDGFLENVGRGMAREVVLKLPGLWTKRVAPMIKANDKMAIGDRYSDRECFLKQIDDLAAVVEYEDELGNTYQQEG